MKKILLTLIIGIGVAGIANATLWDFYNGNLPTVSDRASLATECDISDYRGTYDQNISLEKCLRNKNILGSTTSTAPTPAPSLYRSQTWTGVNTYTSSTISSGNNTWTGTNTFSGTTTLGTTTFNVQPVGATKFGGDGSDGTLNITSGTTTIDLGGEKIVRKNYTSINISGNGHLQFTNSSSSGTVIILKSKGNVDITCTSSPCITIQGIGGAASTYSTFGTAGLGGKGAGSLVIEVGGYLNFTGTINASGINGTTGTGSSCSGGFEDTGSGASGMCSLGTAPSGGNKGCGGVSSDGAGGSALNTTFNTSIFYKNIQLFTGGGGGNGCKTGSCIGSGGGGGGGSVYIFYNFLTANSGTISVNGGSGGGAGGTNQGGGGGGSYTAGSSGQSGGNGTGGNGIYLITKNEEF